MNASDPSTAWWISFWIMWAATGSAIVVLTHYRRLLRQALTNVRGLVEWANWTILTVTSEQGVIEAWTLRQVYDWQISERVWDHPVSVALWQTNGELAQRWQQDAVALFTAPPEEDCGA